jgi:short subunit dehydrogenase-like uncharacterized protein
MPDRFMIYGATGYTGKLVAAAAKTLGMAPLLAGRDAARLQVVAAQYGFDHRRVALDDAAGLRAALAGIPLVLHIAGPFAQTSRPMLDACLAAGTHYLDITGEIDVFEACAARDAEARAAGIMVMPGVGFDVVPSDCLAAHVKRRMPDAVELTLAISGLTKASRGTLKTSIASIARAEVAYRTTDLRARLARHHGANVDCAFLGWSGAWLAPAFRDWNIEEEIGKIPAPMLLVQGEDDDYGTLAQVNAILAPVIGGVRVLVRAADGLHVLGPHIVELAQPHRNAIVHGVVDPAAGRPGQVSPR